MAADNSSITFTLSSSLDELERLSDTLSDIGARWNLPQKTVLQLNLALDELFTNAVTYGLKGASGQQITFTLEKRVDRLDIVVSDRGSPFDPTRAADPALDLPLDEQRIGGLGIYLVRRYTDSFAYRREAGENIVTLTKII